MKELLSFKKSMVRFLFNGEGLDVHLVELFFFDIFLARRSFAKRVPAALAFTFFRGARTTRSIARAFGSLLAWHIGACTSDVSLSFTTPTAIGCTGVISAVETSTSFGALPPLTDTWTAPYCIRDTESMHP